ncbi:MAG: SIR2 family protein [Acidiferrobacterales bacterium]
MNDNTVHNDRNVYILGAGFSADAGMPLVAGFMNTMRDAMMWLEPQQSGRSREVEAIKAVFKFRRNAAAASLRTHIDVENIEELFSLAAASRQDGQATDEHNVALAIAATLDYAASQRSNVPRAVIWFDNTPAWTPPAGWVMAPGFSPAHYDLPVYDLYLGVMSGYFSYRRPQRNTLITFNYDTVVDDALERLGLPYDYALPDEKVRWHDGRPRNTGTQLLKLHGSVNWAISSSAKPDTKIDIFESYDAVRHAGPKGDLVLAPPTWRKGWGPDHPMTAVWDAAVDALSKATRIIIIGYSLPVTDSHFKYLMSAGLRDNISLRKILFVNGRTLRDFVDTGEERPRSVWQQQLWDRLFQVLRPELEDRGIAELVFTPALDFFRDVSGILAREQLAPDLKSVR